MDGEAVARFLAEHLPLFSGSEGSMQATPSHDTEWHRVYFVGDGQAKVVVSIPSWFGTEVLSKTLAEEALAGLGPRHLATLRCEDQVLLVNEFFEGGTLKPADLNADVLAKVGSLYAQLHQVDIAWFDPVRQKLLEEQVLSSSDCNWAFCLWVLPRFLRISAARGGVVW